MTKYIVVSGGVISGIGKGVIASSTGLLLKQLGLRVTAIKVDPYLNVDASLLNPLEHGEVFVLNDGAESDLDLGNYERYLDVTLTRDNNITTGKIYRHVIEEERKGSYLGKTVQVVPHLTGAIQDWIERVAAIPVDESGGKPDVCIIELGGTVGDIESAPFVEAMRQFQFRVGIDNFALIHVSLVPVVGANEQKTKPTQASIRDLRGLGLNPDMIACRCSSPLEPATVSKIAMFCHVSPEQVMAVHDVSSVYHVPLLLQSQGLAKYLTKRLNLDQIQISKSLKQKGQVLEARWRAMTIGQERLFDTVTVVLVGKYTALKDSYMSVTKSLEHAAMRCNRKLTIKWVEAADLETLTGQEHPVRFHEAWHAVCSANGILVPGGFGMRGTEGMIQAIKWARTQKVPFLGVCLGLQMAVIEFARNVCGMAQAQSAEMFPDTPEAAIVFMPEIDRRTMGGTMRLGLRATVFQDESAAWSKARKLYGNVKVIYERHRHRYEVNPELTAQLEAAGLSFSGKDETGDRMEIIEIEAHPFFLGVQYHPEYLTRPLNPSPPYLGLVAAASGLLDDVLEGQRSYQPPCSATPQPSPPLEATTQPVEAGRGRANGHGQAVGGSKTGDYLNVG